MSAQTKEYFSRLESLFQRAVETAPGEERDAFLNTSCDGNEALLRDLRGLLDGDLGVRQNAPAPNETLPRFGVYHARELIGRGGMGAVYLATREDGELNLRVAVKVISSPLCSSLLEERFRRERQILAQLRHPNIAAFLDGGVTDRGLPFLVMEYVDGETVVSWCDRRNLPIRDRLRIFLRICGAVAFAHGQLVVHRDIKPANVLVTEGGEPKLLDFGLARSVESTGSSDKNPTLFLTPLYSSPEVLRGEPAAVTDDVYSLGVLLYELFTGSRPSSSEGSTAACPPSALVAGNPVLQRALKGDPDAIALKAVAHSAAGRYSSVAELEADIGNYLAGRSVQASAGGPLYRTRKFLSRHKPLAAAALLVVLSIAAGTTAALVEAREARLQRAIAERRFQDARELARYMMFELQTSIQKLPGATPVKAEIVAHSVEYLDRLAAENAYDSPLRVDVAEGYCELADVLGHPLRPNLGHPEDARQIYGKAILLVQPVVVSDPNNSRAGRVLARAQLMLGMSLTYYRQWDEGRKLVETAAESLRALARRQPRDFEILKQAGDAMDSLAVTISQRDGFTVGGDKTAVDDVRQSIHYSEAALAMKPADPETVSQLASALNRLALLTQTNDRPTAAQYFDKALATLNALPAPERATAAFRGRRASVLLASGFNLGSEGRYDQGIAAIDEARALIEQLASEDPQNRVYPRARASIYRNRGVIQDYAGRSADALQSYSTAISIFRQMLAADPVNPYFRTSLADLQANSALLCVKLGRRAEGVTLLHAALPVFIESASKLNASAPELNLAARFLAQDDFPALCQSKKGLAFAQRANALTKGKDSIVLETLAQAWWINGKRAPAVQAMSDAIALLASGPSRITQLFTAKLAKYRADKLPNACPY